MNFVGECGQLMITVLLLCFSREKSKTAGLFLQKRFKRERAFDLAHIESDLEEEELRKARWEQSRAKDFALFRDKMCQDKCNDNLRRGLDMVKAHVAFGSIGVPPLVDGTDLKFFCRLDNQHSRCLHDCGFAVQFNMHDFICKRYYLEMLYLLPCYTYAAPALRNECGSERCGPYTSLENSLIGYAHRCRVLMCDIKCTTNVLLKNCGNGYGRRAANFLLSYIQQQVLAGVVAVRSRSQYHSYYFQVPVGATAVRKLCGTIQVAKDDSWYDCCVQFV